MTGRPDFADEGLLSGLQGKARDARQRLLEQLWDAGLGLPELKDAVAADRLVVLPAEQALSGRPEYTARDITERAELSLDYFHAVLGAAGLAPDDPDERAYDKEGRQAAEIIGDFHQLGLDPDAMLEVARVAGRGLAQTADAMGELFAQTFIKAGVTEEEIGMRNAQAASEMLPRVTPLLAYILKRHMRERLRHQAVSQAMLEVGQIPGTRDVAVAFIDMVSFTQLGERLSIEAVGTIVGRLGKLANECAAPPVRLIKTIGDAAMLAAPEPQPLIDAIFNLLDAAARAGPDFPQLRAGAAYGPALNRSGDWYGRTVNLASRITDTAEANTVVVTQDLRAEVDDSGRWTEIGTREFKGIAGPIELFRADRPAETGSTTHSSR